MIFGVVNPAARSPQTYYSDDSELPPLGNMDLYSHKGTTCERERERERRGGERGPSPLSHACHYELPTMTRCGHGSDGIA